MALEKLEEEIERLRKNLKSSDERMCLIHTSFENQLL